MTFQVYRCRTLPLSEERERLQMSRLLGYLEQEFTHRKEDCSIIIEPTISYEVQGKKIRRKPDAIIMKDNLFILVDLKPYTGDINADCSPGALWRSRDDKILQKVGTRNPFDQVEDYRKILTDFLKAGFMGDAPPWAKKDEVSLDFWINRHIHTWVFTAEASNPVVTGTDWRGLPVDSRSYPRFKVIPMDGAVNSLAFLGSSEPLLRQAEMKRFIEVLGAQPTTRKEWNRGALIVGQDQFLELIPVISNWMASGDYNDLLRSMERIKELNLKQHLVHVLRCWRDQRFADLRQQALLILIEDEWQYEELGQLLDEALKDKDPSIVKFTLDYLTRNRYVEPLHTLEEMLERGSEDLRPSVITAISLSGGANAASTIFEFAKKNIFNSPFKSFQYWSEKAGQAIHGEDRKAYEEFAILDQKRTNLIRTCNEVIRAVGDLNYKASIPWLRSIIESPTSIGFESDDYGELEDIGSDYSSVFRAACESLAKIAVGDSTATEILLKHLDKSPEDYQWYIVRALGDLREPIAGHYIMPFLEKNDESTIENAVRALVKIHYIDAFDKVLTIYKARLLESSHGFFDYQEFYKESLIALDKEKFEVFLLEMVGSSELSSEQKRGCFAALNAIVTERSIDTLEPLLSDPELAEEAAIILSLLTSERRKEITTRLLSSDNAQQRYLGFTTMWFELHHSYEKLAAFETDRNEKIRRDVAWTYLNLRDYHSVLKFENDVCIEAREAVSRAYERISAIQELPWTHLMDGSESMVIQLYLTGDSLVVCDPQFHFEHIPISDIDGFCQVSSESQSGLLFVRRKGDQLVKHLFILKLDHEYYPFDVQSWVRNVEGDYAKFVGKGPDPKLALLHENWIKSKLG